MALPVDGHNFLETPPPPTLYLVVQFSLLQPLSQAVAARQARLASSRTSMPKVNALTPWLALDGLLDTVL